MIVIKSRWNSDMPARLKLDKSGDLEVAVAQAIEACDGDLRATIRALILANQFLEAQVSQGYRRGVIHGRFNCYNG